MKKGILFVVIGALIAFWAGPAYAALVWVDDSTKAKGATIVTWDSSFADFDYTVDGTITMTVSWTVDAGVAEYQSFRLKRFTPRSKKDPADGEVIGPPTVSGTSVTVNFAFDELHLDKRRNVEIGNAHFKLYLMIDKDGDGAVDSLAGYGVNVHVEDPQ